MNTLTDKQLEILVEILRQNKKIAVPVLHGELEQKGIRVHINEVRNTVSKLEKKKTGGLIDIKRETYGVRTFYKLIPKSDYDTFKKLGKHLLRSPLGFEFIHSKYVQSMIDEAFVDHFAVDWCREYYRLLQKQGSRIYGKDVDEIEDDKLRSGFYANLGEAFTKEAFTEEEIEKSPAKERLVKIFRTSPMSLYNFLFPQELFEEGEIRVLTIGDYFLWPFISDMAHALPKGMGMKVKLELDYGNLTESNVQKITSLISKKAKWLKPTLKAKTESGIYNPKPEEVKHADNP